MEDDIGGPPLDPLSERQIEILRRIAEGLTDREIAQELFLSLNTIKWHNKQIYSKLGVGRRYQAVAKAKEYGLLDPQPDLSAGQRPEFRHNLPAAVTSFIGRERELTEVKELLGTTRLLTLTGPGGIGKTRLVLEAAFQQLETFEDGVCFVPLAALQSAEAIIPTLAEYLDLSFFAAEDLKAQLLAYLRDKRILLVLDNFEHLLNGASLLSEILQIAPGVKIIATSRERLNLLSETVFTTPGLDVPSLELLEDALEFSSVRLFIQCAQRARAEFVPSPDDVRDIAQVCQLVQGMPLALELAAAWVSTLTCQEIAAEIERGLDILESELRDVPQRMRSIRAVFDHSWSLALEEEREVYQRLSVFRGGFTREAAAYVASASLKLLSTLVNKSLIWRRATGRYEMHELLRWYGEERLLRTPGAWEQTADLHSIYFAEFMYRRRTDLLGKDQVEVIKEIEEEIGNVRAAWSWAITQRNLDALDKQGESLLLFYETRSRYQEGLEAFVRAVDAVATSSHAEEGKTILGRLLVRQSHFSTRLGDYDEARGLLEQGRMLFQDQGNRDELAEILTRLAAAEFYMGNYEDADRLLHECLPMHKESGKMWQLAWTSFWLGRVNTALGKYEKAEQFLRDAVTIHRRIGETYNLPDALIALGWVMHKIGDDDEAVRLEKEGLAIATEVGSPHRIAWALLSLGRIELARNQFEEATSHFHVALQSALDILSVRLQLDALAGIGELLMREGDTERAAELLFLIYHHPSSEAETRLQAEALLGELGFGQATTTRETDAEGMVSALDSIIEAVYTLPQFSQLRSEKEPSGGSPQ